MYVESKHDPMPHHRAGLSYTRSGYGKKIPSPTKVFLQGRWRRVYVTQYSNAGTCWIIVNGVKHIVMCYGDTYEVDPNPWGVK